MSNSIMGGLQLGLQQQRADKLDERFDKMFMDKNEFARGRQGLPPVYTEEESMEQAAATRPEIPSSVPTSTPGPLGIPKTQFDEGAPVQPMPVVTPRPVAGGAAALLPPTPSRLPGGMGTRRMGLSRYGFNR